MARGWTADVDALPPQPGAYALLVDLHRPVELPARCRASELAPGTYVYLGSARGAGGIRARCRRHLQSEKAVHWHIDRLTVAALPGRVRVAAFPEASECALAQCLEERPRTALPVIEFGNTDCRSCQAHLFSLQRNTRPETILRVLEGRAGEQTA